MTATPSAAATLPNPNGVQPTSIQQLCDMQAWPRAVPSVAGLILGDADVGALGCWDNIRAIAPDGHDAESDPEDMTQGRTYRITDVSPAPGTLIGRADTVTLKVVPVDLLAVAPALHPCDWITTDEAAKFLGASVTTEPVGDEAGSVEPFCEYLSGGGEGVTSQLFLPGSFPVDAASEFSVRTVAVEQSVDVDGLPGPARCTTVQREKGPLHTLLVLLSDNRLYSVDTLNVSCDALLQFAHTAVARI